MIPDEQLKVESNDMKEFARVMQAHTDAFFTIGRDGDSARDEQRRKRININQDNVKKGLGQLVLTLVKLVHELMEKQAIRRMDAGSLTNDEVENIGLTLMKQAEEIDRLSKAFGLEDKDLNLDLGPLGKLF